MFWLFCSCPSICLQFFSYLLIIFSSSFPIKKKKQLLRFEPLFFFQKLEVYHQAIKTINRDYQSPSLPASLPLFLCASSHLYKSMCLSVGRFIGKMHKRLHQSNSIIAFQCIRPFLWLFNAFRTHHWPQGLHSSMSNPSVTEEPQSKLGNHHMFGLTQWISIRYRQR